MTLQRPLIQWKLSASNYLIGSSSLTGDQYRWRDDFQVSPFVPSATHKSVLWCQEKFSWFRNISFFSLLQVFFSSAHDFSILAARKKNLLQDKSFLLQERNNYVTKSIKLIWASEIMCGRCLNRVLIKIMTGNHETKLWNKHISLLGCNYCRLEESAIGINLCAQCLALFRLKSTRVRKRNISS